MAFLSLLGNQNGNKKADNTLGYIVSKPDEEYDFSVPESKFAEEYTPEEIAANKQERFNNTVKWCIGTLCFASYAALVTYLKANEGNLNGGKSKRNKGKDKRRKKTRKRTLRKKQKTVI
jgi:hypothetical protein